MKSDRMQDDLSIMLLDYLAEKPDIHCFINRMAEYMGNPLAMVDGRFRVLYASDNMELSIPLWEKTMEEHYVSDAIIGAMEKGEILEKVRHSSEAFRLGLPDGYHAIRAPLFYQGESCGFLGVYNYVRPFAQTDMKSMEIIAKALTVMYMSDPDILGRIDDSRNDLFLELIKCKSQDIAGVVLRKNRSTSFGKNKVLVCLTRRIHGMSAENVAFGRLRDFLDKNLYVHVSAVYNNQLLLMFSLEKISNETRESIIDSIDTCCRRYDLNAGISFEFDDDSFIPYAYKQSRKAALYGSAASEKRQRTSTYEDYMLSDMMNAALRVHGAKFYEHPVITRLTAYDNEFGTKYLDTLRIYLRTYCNMKATASEMGVHYNTVKYRLSMIEEICSRDIRDNSSLLRRIEYSLAVHDFAESGREHS